MDRKTSILIEIRRNEERGGYEHNLTIDSCGIPTYVLLTALEDVSMRLHELEKRRIENESTMKKKKIQDLGLKIVKNSE